MSARVNSLSFITRFLLSSLTLNSVAIFLFLWIWVPSTASSLNGLLTHNRTTDSTKSDSKAEQKPERRIQKLSPLKELQADIDDLFDNSDFSNAFIGCSILSIETGDYIYRKNEMKNFVPASTQKLLTTATALQTLGDTFRFSTRLYLDGSIQKSGEFNGNLIIRGSGDPSLNRGMMEDPLDVLHSWAQVLDSLGVRMIRGKIIGDDSYFTPEQYPPGWTIDDISYPYSAQVSALSIADNSTTLTITPSTVLGEPASIELYPASNYVRIVNDVITTSGTESSPITATREPNSNVIILRGRIPLGLAGRNVSTVLSVTVENPTLYFAHLFRSALEQRGITFRGAILDIDDANEDISYTTLTRVAEYFSPPLREIVGYINKTSYNLGAECLLKTIGKETSGVGSFSEGIQQIRKFASTIGMPPEGMNIADGSGLSRFNLSSPHQQVVLLSGMYRSTLRSPFLASLAVPGALGTLRNRMTSSRAEKFVVAKTGSMNNVNNIAGYAVTRDSEPFAFSIMINNFTVPASLATNLQDLVCMRLSSFTRKQ